MKLLRRYKQPGRSAEVETVVVAGPHHVATRGKVWDLRSGAVQEKSAGALWGRDGARVEWKRDGTLWLINPDGAATALHGTEGLSTQLKLVGDEVVLVQADGRQPLLCIDRATGQPAGRLEGQRGEPYGQMTLFNVAVFDPGDGKTVWLAEGGRVACFDLGTRRATKSLEPADDEKFLGVAVHTSGAVLTIARKKSAGFDTTHDELVLFSPDGSSRRVKRVVMSTAPLQDGFVAFDPAAKAFVFFDLELRQTGTLAHDSNWVRCEALPSRREWLSIGGKGEWDHHGDEALAPPEDVSASKAPKAPKEPKAKAKKPAGKKAR